MAEESAVAIPAPATSLLGRASELDHARDLLWNPDVRLVSLLGPGGIGKTRLATEIAWQLHQGPGFTNGVYFVDLAAVRDPGLVPATIGHSLGLVDMGSGDDVRRLCAAVREWDALLVLDNFEQVVPAAQVVSELLAAAPRLSILVTSRRPLHLSGEHQIEVTRLAAADAVELFVTRARAVRPGFAIDAETAPVVDAICDVLDGLPLAIELAAARSKVLSPAELHSRLGRSVSLLSHGPIDQPERLRSMDATLSWSYDGLADDVQAVFRQLSVFSGGWITQAAEAVCVMQGSHVVDALAVLLDHHLIVRGDTAPESRWTMFETVREFGLHALETDPGNADVHARHAAWCLRLVRRAEPEFSRTDQVEWLDRVETEHDNIRAVLSWGLDADPESALAIAGTMWRFWLLRGYASEGLDWLERAIGVAGDAPSNARARALIGSGSMLEAIGDDAGAEARYLTALRDFEALGDRAGTALTYRHLGNANLGQGLYDRSTQYYLQTVELGRELGDDLLVAGAVSNLGGVAFFQGDYARAEAHWTEATAAFRAANDANRLASSLNNLAELAALRGQPACSLSLHQEVLVLRRQLRDPIGQAQTLVNLGKVVHATGDLARAQSLLEEALVRLRALGIERDTGVCLYNLALLAREQGRGSDAAALAGESLAIKSALGEQFDLAQCLELLATLAADRGLGARAARLLGAAARLRSSIGARPLVDEPDAAVIDAAVRRAAGDDGMAMGIAEGETWSVERAVAEATEIAMVSPPGTTRGADVSVPVSPAAARTGLTDRELEVLSYLVERYTDREIAEALTISPRTVTTHVARILMKLGVEGRRQAAAEAARLRLFAS